MEKLTKKLTVKYALLQSTFCISQCIISSFAAVYLKSRNFSNMQIGIVLAVGAVLSILLQPIVASIADKSEKITLRYIVILILVTVFAFGFALLLLPGYYWLIACIFILITALQYTLIPLLNALAIEYINLGVPINYGLARGMGSVFYAVMSAILGLIVNYYEPGIIIFAFLIIYPFVLLSTFLFKANVSKTTQISEIENKEATKKEASIGLWKFFQKYKKFTLQLVGLAMLYYSLSIINTYLINIIENVGGNSFHMGVSISIAAALELPTMAAFTILVKKVRCSTLLKISAFFFLIKSALIWLAPNITMIYFAMSFQLVSFALYTPASVYYVNSVMDEKNKVKGQALLVAATNGISCTVANITGGKLLDSYGVSTMLIVGTIVTAIGFIIVLFTTDRTESISTT